ncbi:uncharacterized protein LOC118736298 [Rhagoletis pomonella]|uniref:uncharacterized protein LOC118736298 n=1 Tax=Rhagoletis pomonella TaxID=28610 RepID=UPI00177DBC8C|nr:uncharacterized protein LOC118736298 [Rhagoletis pomonella]
MPQDLQLHIFVDASEDAFVAISYWRTTNSAGEIEVAFVCSKAKCAPLKPIKVPRLELQVAILGTRLMQTLREEHAVKASSCILWSDSKTVVKWIKSEHRRYKPFVAHRVAEILSATTPSNWIWLSTAENVADEATRAKSRHEYCSTSLWLCGPKFLLSNEVDWPKEAGFNDQSLKDEEELSPKFARLVVSNRPDDINRFSSFNKLVRTTAWVLRFTKRCRCGRRAWHAEQWGLISEEVDASKKLLFRHFQEEAFALDLQSIADGIPIPLTCDLYQLSPYKDEDNVLRVNGRIDAASWLPFSTKRPVISPSNHALTKLLVQHHAVLKHQNTEATICEIRRTYWIPRLRQLLRKIIADCLVCRINKAAPVTSLMGPLPVDHLEPFVRPFTYTGLDYFGPIMVTIGRRQEKRWVALFTCLTVRAVHLELAYVLSTDACIIAIRNCINRRGVPVRLRSDNGKNFVGANEEANKFSEVFDCERVQNELASKGIQWRFNCPVNTSEGGVWERMVQCVKGVLRNA